uniref:Transmembrane protein n=1 Tax=Syphacia muris TaxID=451379 RepID=A0A0N5AIU6_9BILA
MGENPLEQFAVRPPPNTKKGDKKKIKIDMNTYFNCEFVLLKMVLFNNAILRVIMLVVICLMFGAQSAPYVPCAGQALCGSAGVVQEEMFDDGVNVFV